MRVDCEGLSGRKAMKSKWKVTSNSINGEKMYAIFRLSDISAVDHSGNREYAGGYIADREMAQTAADALNAEEGTHED